MDKFTETVQHTFLDYLAGGYELNFMVAVDFTGAYLDINVAVHHNLLSANAYHDRSDCY